MGMTDLTFYDRFAAARMLTDLGPVALGVAGRVQSPSDGAHPLLGRRGARATGGQACA
jgi:hypothetical protein